MAISTFGRAIGVNSDNTYLEDSTKTVDTTETLIFAGRPVYIDGSGAPALTPVLHAYDANSNNLRVYGIAKFNKNVYIDETKGALGGIYGGGKGTVVKKGIVSIRPISFILSNDTELTVDMYNSALTYLVGQPLYVELYNASKLGQITNVLDTTHTGAGVNGTTLLGYVTKPPSATDPVLELELI